MLARNAGRDDPPPQWVPSLPACPMGTAYTQKTQTTEKELEPKVFSFQRQILARHADQTGDNSGRRQGTRGRLLPPIRRRAALDTFTYPDIFPRGKQVSSCFPLPHGECPRRAGSGAAPQVTGQGICPLSGVKGADCPLPSESVEITTTICNIEESNFF
mgnify:CR=1 FL=1